MQFGKKDVGREVVAESNRFSSESTKQLSVVQDEGEGSGDKRGPLPPVSAIPTPWRFCGDTVRSGEVYHEATF